VTADRVARAEAVLGFIGGVLRAAGSFAPTLIGSDEARTLLYITVDVCLTAGLMSIYLPRRHRMNAVGAIGFFLALAGLVAGRTSPAITKLDLYPVTAAAVAIGVLALTLAEWRSKRMTGWIPVVFGLSFALGSMGTVIAGAGALFIVSGILFGCAFAAMAVQPIAGRAAADDDRAESALKPEA